MAQEEDDEAPELRKLLDEMHGKESSIFDEDESDVPEQPEQGRNTMTESTSDGYANQPKGEQNSMDTPKTPLPSGAEPLTFDAAQVSSEPLYFEPPEQLRGQLEQIPVTLECSLKSLNKTLGEVSQLSVGEILPLHCQPEGPVDLKANGRLFAKARLVVVEGQLAVEVIEKFD